jgi:D-inositol-3-phosphate glycosyltransferase
MVEKRLRAALRVAMLCIHSSPFGRLGTRNTGGMSVYVRELSRWLGDSGHRVDIFTWRTDPDELEVHTVAENVRIVAIQPPGVDGKPDKDELWRYDGACAEQIDRFRKQDAIHYEIIHSNYWISGLVGELLKGRWQCPHVMSFHTLATAKTSAAPGHREPEVRRAAEHQLARNCDMLFAPTAAEALRYEQLGAEVIRPMPCGVDLGRFTPSGNPKKPQSCAELLFVGRFDAMKGVEVLVAALGTIVARQPARLTLIGGDGAGSDAYEWIHALAAEHGVEPFLHCRGAIAHENMVHQYRQADCVVVSSHYESFGLVVLEALACGIPVASTRVGISAEVIKQGVNGWLAPPGDAAALAGAVEQSLIIAGQVAPATIRASISGFDWRQVADLSMDGYNEALTKINP